MRSDWVVMFVLQRRYLKYLSSDWTMDSEFLSSDWLMSDWCDYSRKPLLIWNSRPKVLFYEKEGNKDWIDLPWGGQQVRGRDQRAIIVQTTQSRHIAETLTGDTNSVIELKSIQNTNKIESSGLGLHGHFGAFSITWNPTWTTVMEVR